MVTNDAASILIALPTLGCKVNRYDSDTLARALSARGYTIVPPSQMADLYIINTCTVTAGADSKSRKLLRRALKINPQAKIIVTGCAASLAPEQFSTLPNIHAVVPINEQFRIPDIISELLPVKTMPPGHETGGLQTSIARTRATVKVQDGCDRQCAYCAVTLARGDLRSRGIAEIISELQAHCARGVGEAVLTGIRLDAYGRDFNSSLAELLHATREIPLKRLRLSSLEPIGIDNKLLQEMASHPTLCHHFHLCLQSGDDGVLAAMQRGYTADDYRQLIDDFRRAMPDAQFTTDIIVGFPGESSAAFENSCRLVKEIAFLKLHIFKYSPRSGTLAAQMPEQIAENVKEERSSKLFSLQQELFQQYAQKMLGTDCTILAERTGLQGNGLTPQYIRVLANIPAKLAGCEVKVRITGYGDEYLLGAII